MDYKSALEYILGLTNFEKSLKDLYSPGNVDLERVRLLLARLGSPHYGPGIVHVAGTKGKGSTAAMVASVLRASGYKTGLYTSPHLHTFRERIRIDGRMISQHDFANGLAEVKPFVEEINREARYGRLSTFEVLTALALLYFRKKKAEIEVLEVGLGGRLDATNVVDSDVAVITSISRDHTELLGETLPEIAGEKAGIIKQGSIVVTAPQEEEVDRVLDRICKQRAAHRISVGTEITWESGPAGIEGQEFVIDTPHRRYDVKTPLLGDHQLENAGVAIGVLEVLKAQGWNIPMDGIRRGFEDLSWPGRFEVLSQAPLLVVDGAHNGASARRLREALERYFAGRKVVLIVGISSDKNIEEIVAELVPVASRVVVTRSRHPRAAPAAQVAAAFREADVIVDEAESVADALELATSAGGREDLICATGSLFIVGEVIQAVKKVPAEQYV